MREKTLGPDHPEVANSLSNLASLYEDQGRYAEAEPLYKRSLVIREKAAASGPPDVTVLLNNAVALNSLANLYVHEGKYADAERLYKRSLAIREKAAGPGHPDFAQSLGNLANLYMSQGKYA